MFFELTMIRVPAEVSCDRSAEEQDVNDHNRNNSAFDKRLYHWMDFFNLVGNFILAESAQQSPHLWIAGGGS